MKCPYGDCVAMDTEVTWTRIPKKHPGQVHRGRRCMWCGRNFTTAEVVRGMEAVQDLKGEALR